MHALVSRTINSEFTKASKVKAGHAPAFLESLERLCARRQRDAHGNLANRALGLLVLGNPGQGLEGAGTLRTGHHDDLDFVRIFGHEQVVHSRPPMNHWRKAFRRAPVTISFLPALYIKNFKCIRAYEAGKYESTHALFKKATVGSVSYSRGKADFLTRYSIGLKRIP